MEFDEATCTNRWTFYDIMKAKFESIGYNIPNIVFWNVDSRNNVFHVKSDYKGVQLASGQSASVFKSILDGVDLNPYDMMIQTLSNPVYDCITV